GGAARQCRGCRARRRAHRPLWVRRLPYRARHFRSERPRGAAAHLMARRIYIAGVLRNSPDNMMTWLVSPQQVIPGNAMPDMGVSATDARDMTAYLYTLR